MPGIANLYMVVWKTFAYSIATVTPLAPWIGDGEFWFSQDALGIIALRYGVLLILLWNIGVMGWRSWQELINISVTVGHPRPDPSISRQRILYISAVPFIIMGTFMATRLWHLEDQINSVGWTYGPTFIGSLIILAVVNTIHYWAHRYLSGSIGRRSAGTRDRLLDIQTHIRTEPGQKNDWQLQDLASAMSKLWGEPEPVVHQILLELLPSIVASGTSIPNAVSKSAKFRRPGRMFIRKLRRRR